MDQIYEKAREAADYIRDRFKVRTDIAMITGTGIDLDFEVVQEIAYTDIPHFVRSTVDTHKGLFKVVRFEGNEFIVLNGRFHYYEGYSAKEITFPIRVLKELGVKNLFITNVTGGLNESYDQGDIVFLNDHINLQPEHPLRGKNDNRLGIRFPDMMKAYDPQLLSRAKDICEHLNISFKTGVYACLQGPSLETPAEYRFLHQIGADMVGMSTVPEVIVANHAGIKVLVASIISNVCYPPERLSETTIEEVVAVARQSGKQLQNILKRFF